MFKTYKTIKYRHNRIHIAQDSRYQSNCQNEEKLCRICYGQGRNLVSPCQCKGSVKYIHKHCLLKWIKVSKSKKCEICNSKYKVNIITRRKLSFWQKLKKKFKSKNSYQINIYDL